MPDGIPKAAAVALVPCFNEGRNPLDLADALLSVPNLRAVFIDDAGDAESRAVLDALGRRDARIVVAHNATRIGKVASLLAALRSPETAVDRIVLIDCDVAPQPGAVERVLDELDRADLVLANAVAIQRPRTLWERGAIFSANRHDRLRLRAHAKYPALFANGRLLGMTRRLADTVLRGDVPPHTEDAHFMLTCLSEGYAYAYRRDAVLHYRAPDRLSDYLRQSNRFSDGRALLRERWGDAVLARWYDPKPFDMVASALATAARDPLGALVFSAMLAAKAAQRRTSQRSGTWAVAASTKALR